MLIGRGDEEGLDIEPQSAQRTQRIVRGRVLSLSVGRDLVVLEAWGGTRSPNNLCSLCVLCG